jgi:hypothetical protein
VTYLLEQLPLAPHALSFLLILNKLGVGKAVGVESIKKIVPILNFGPREADTYGHTSTTWQASLTHYFNNLASRYYPSHITSTPWQADTIPHTLLQHPGKQILSVTHFQHYFNTQACRYYPSAHITSTPWQADAYLYNTSSCMQENKSPHNGSPVFFFPPSVGIFFPLFFPVRQPP